MTIVRPDLVHRLRAIGILTSAIYFPILADIEPSPGDVRFTPRKQTLLCATSRKAALIAALHPLGTNPSRLSDTQDVAPTRDDEAPLRHTCAPRWHDCQSSIVDLIASPAQQLGAADDLGRQQRAQWRFNVANPRLAFCPIMIAAACGAPRQRQRLRQRDKSIDISFYSGWDELRAALTEARRPARASPST